MLTTLLEEPKEALIFLSLFLEATDISNFSSYMSQSVEIWFYRTVSWHIPLQVLHHLCYHY